MIHVAYRLYGGDGFYAKMTGTSMLSLFAKTNLEVTVHIMHNDSLTSDNRDKLNYIANQYNQNIEFHNIEKIAGESLKKYMDAFPFKLTAVCFYPMVLHEVLPDVKRIISLGADTLFNLDVKEFLNYNIDNYPMAVVPEYANGEVFALNKNLAVSGLITKEYYFNSDVLYMNLDFWRKSETNKIIMDGMKFLNEHKEYALYNEQDLLSYCFSETALKLPVKFNCFISGERILRKSNELKEVLYHYAGGSFGFGLQFNMNDVYNKLWFDYFSKTPWFNVDIIGNLSEAIYKFYDEQKNILRNVTNLISKKKRAFFTEIQNFEFLKQCFMITPEEKLINASNPQSMNELMQSMRASNSQEIYFIMVGNYKLAREILIKNNFVENRDFLDGTIFLSDKQGVPFNSYFIAASI